MLAKSGLHACALKVKSPDVLRVLPAVVQEAYESGEAPRPGKTVQYRSTVSILNELTTLGQHTARLLNHRLHAYFTKPPYHQEW